MLSDHTLFWWAVCCLGVNITTGNWTKAILLVVILVQTLRLNLAWIA